MGSSVACSDTKAIPEPQIAEQQQCSPALLFVHMYCYYNKNYLLPLTHVRKKIMKDYVRENDRILEEWRADYVRKNRPLYPNCTNLEAYFALDGIMNKGIFAPCINIDGTFSRWERKPSGEENTLWNDTPLRILFLTKDQNTSGNESWDVRSESFRYRSETILPSQMCFQRESRLYVNLAYLLYCLINTTPQKKACLESITDRESLDAAILEVIDNAIFARINCKKEVGEARCDNRTLENAINEDKQFLKEQIVNLDADILVCCGFSSAITETGNHMLNFLNTIGYNFPKSKDDWIYYDEGNNKLAINSYHLSYLGFDYRSMIDAYYDFLKQYPDFVNSHRAKL